MDGVTTTTRSMRFLPKLIVFLIVVGALGSSLYFYNQLQTVQKKLKNPNEVNQQEVKSLIEKVGKLIDLPTDETPTVATVTDKTKLKNQPFFKRAENGDKVLIYTKAKKAILYRPSTNKIIEVATINIGKTQNQNPSTAPSPSETQKPLPTATPAR